MILKIKSKNNLYALFLVSLLFSSCSEKNKQEEKEKNLETHSENKEPEKIADGKCNFSKIEQSGRDEPIYLNRKGYLVEFNTQNLYDRKPTKEQRVVVLKQIGPNKWGESGETLPNKTEAHVIEQNLWHKGYGIYDGILKVRLTNGKELYVDIKKFVPGDYWNCEPLVAIEFKPFFAKLKNLEPKPINKDKEWIDLDLSSEFVCTTRTYEKLLECYIYKNYKYGYGGIIHYFEPSNVYITY
jgi:hypothetical protein